MEGNNYIIIGKDVKERRRKTKSVLQERREMYQERIKAVQRQRNDEGKYFNKKLDIAQLDRYWQGILRNLQQ